MIFVTIFGIGFTRRDMRSVLLSLFALTFSVATLLGQSRAEQDVFVPIAKYLQAGDSEKLSAWFAHNLEIEVLGSVNVCSKAQAKQILKEFFTNYTPKSFAIAIRSGKAPMKYAIGSLSAGGEKFRVTLFVKTQEDGNFIQQLRIEKE